MTRHATSDISYDPTKNPHRDNPYPLYEVIRRHEPVWDPGLQVHLVAGHDTIRAITEAPDRFASHNSAGLQSPLPIDVAEILANAQPITTPLVEQDGEAHRRTRHLWQHLLRAERIAALRPSIQANAHALIDQFPSSGRIDLVDAYSFPLAKSVISLLAGIPANDQDAMFASAADLLATYNPLLPIKERCDAAQRFVNSDDYLIDLYRDRRTNPRDDLASDAAAALSLPDFAITIRTLYGAGITTPQATLSSMVHALLTTGNWHAAIANPSILKEALEETLRHDTATRGLVRTATADVPFTRPDGTVTTIRRGERVLLLFGGANRDERVFPQPDEFQLGRPRTPRHLAFGNGVHWCVGAMLARTEIRLGVATLGTRLHSLQLASDFQPHYTPGLLFRELQSLWVEYTT